MLERTAWVILVGIVMLGGTVQGQSADRTDGVFQAPGVKVWMGRVPSVDEMRGALREVPARSIHPRSDVPDFQNERVKLYVGKVPSLEVLREAARTAADARR